MSISVPSALGQAPANPPKQKYWTVGEVEDPWLRPRIDPSDRVSWGCADGDIIDISVGGYLRARNKWADRPIDYRPRS